MIRSLLFAALTVAIGYACWDVGQRAARAFERLLVARVQNGFDVLGYGWARVEADGLRLRLYGHAPDLEARHLALESVRAAAPLAEVQNYATATLAPPEHRDPVRVDLLRDAEGVTLTGQTASRAMRSRLNEALAEDGPGLAVQDLTGIQAAAPPRGWGPEIKVASLAASRLSNAYVVMEPGQVSIDGQAADETDREAVTAALLDRAGDRVALVLRIRIPPRVIAPFAFSAYKDAGAGIRLERCAARSFDEQAALLGRLSGAGAAHQPEPCPVGVGGPGGDWTAAVSAGLKALAALPAGRIDIEYRDARLTGAPPTAEAELAAAASMLRGALPDGFEGTATMRGEDASARATIDRDRYWMRVTRDATGVSLGGLMPSEDARRAVETEAAALYGADGAQSTLSVAEGTPPAAWEIAALGVLRHLQTTVEGAADLAGPTVTLHARVIEPASARTIHDALLAVLPDYRIKTALNVDLPAAMQAVPLPPVRCAAELNRINDDPAIEFAPGSAIMTGQSDRVLEALAAALRRCAGGAIMIGGHTDAKGAADLNQKLSQARADAVADALAERGVPAERLVATGFGEDRPIATNETETGRARNRRIEFEPSG